MLKKYIIIFIVLFSYSFSQPKQIDWLEVHNLSIQGIHELYNVNVDKAGEIFNKIINTAPGDPRGYFFNCMMYYFKFTLERKQKDFDSFFVYSDKVIEICENLIDQNKNDYTSRFYLAGIYGYRGLMYQLNNSVFKAVWDGKKGYGMLKDLIREKQDMYDAYLGTGLFDYLLSKIPSGYSWILKLLGYGGDMEKGILELKTAEEKGIYTRTEASIYLAQFLFWEKRYDEAYYYMKNLLAQYPENPLFLVQYANMEAQSNRPENAIVACKKAIKITNDKKIFTADAIPYLVLANALFVTNDFKAASENYELYQSKVPNIGIIRNHNFYKMGLSFDFTGQREKAIKAYNLCKKAEDGDRQDNSFLYDLSQFLIKNPPNEDYKDLTVANNKLSIKKPDEAISLYKNILLRKSLSPDDRISALVGLGSCYFEKNMFSEVLECFEEGIRIQPGLRKHAIPQLYLLKGRTLIKTGKNEEARICLKKVLDFDNYYYQKSIESQAEEELKSIK